MQKGPRNTQATANSTMPSFVLAPRSLVPTQELLNVYFDSKMEGSVPFKAPPSPQVTESTHSSFLALMLVFPKLWAVNLRHQKHLGGSSVQTPARDTHRLAWHARPRLQARWKDHLAQATLGGDP